MTDEARALLIVAALLSGASGSAGFVSGRMSVPVPPAEVRYVQIPVPMAAPAEAAPIEPAPAALEPEPAIAPPVEVTPLPPPRPKAEAKPKDQPAKVQKSHAPQKKSLPSCAVVERQYQSMTMAQRWAAYRSATPEEIAHGRHCLGF